MRLAENSNLEWGYLAPASSFMRAARAVVVATAIGASAGAAVIFSLVDQPMGEETVAARTLVHSVDSGLAQVSGPAPIANAGPASPAASQWSASSTTQGPAITDTPPAQSPAASQWSASSTTQGPAITDNPPRQFVPPQRSCRVPSQTGNRRRSKNRITRSAVHHGTVSRREDRSRSCIYSADLRPVNTGQRTLCTKTRSLATLPIKHTARAVTRGLGLPRVFSVHQIDRSTANLETDS